METIEFLNLVLPTTGFRFGVTMSSTSTTAQSFASNELLAEYMRDQDATKADAYFALGGFTTRTGGRKQENVAALRALWLDLDVGDGAKKYPNQKEAVRALIGFCETTGMPQPMLVSSGYGIHCYWPLTEDLEPHQWRTLATMLKAACGKAGLLADPSRTCDSASILRAPGTHNYKNGGVVDVRVLRPSPTFNSDVLSVALHTYVGNVQAGWTVHSKPGSLNDDLITRPVYTPSSALRIVPACAAMKEFMETGGAASEPFWYRMLGVAAHTIEGEDICHAWSKKDPRYKPGETQRKIDQALQHGPTSCETISSYSDHCHTCPHFGKIKSPIQLGHEVPEEQPVHLTDADMAAIGITSLTYPKGFGFGAPPGEKHDFLWWKTENPEYKPDGTGGEQYIYKQISTVNLYPITRVKTADDSYVMDMCARFRNGETKHFTLPHSAIAEGGKGLSSMLGKQEIAVMSPTAATGMERYLRSWMDKLQSEYTSTPSVEQMGWNKSKHFVVGRDYMTPQGSRAAVVGAKVQQVAGYLHKEGTLKNWVDAVDSAYNYSGQEAFQFCILAAFAAPIYAMYGDPGGLVIFAYAETGKGKSTAGKVGLSAWGNANDLMIEQSQYTINALYNRMGLLQNLPVVVDELTNLLPADASQMVYSTSAGSGKLRMNADATEMETMHWSTLVMTSGNKRLSELLSQHRADASAEMARIWEFSVDSHSKYGLSDGMDLFDVFKENYGHAGEMFAKYLVDNYDAVRTTLRDTRRMFIEKQNIQQKERYWANLHASILVALSITRKLGLVNFEAKPLWGWITDELANARGQLTQTTSTPLEQFADMLADIWSNVLVTIGEGDLKGGNPATVPPYYGHPRGAIMGRYMIACPDTHTAEKLYISQIAINTWCNKHNTSMREMRKALTAEKWSVPELVRISLGKGTTEYSGMGPTKCWEIHASAVRGLQADQPSAARVTKVITNPSRSVV